MTSLFSHCYSMVRLAYSVYLHIGFTLTEKSMQYIGVSSSEHLDNRLRSVARLAPVSFALCGLVRPRGAIDRSQIVRYYTCSIIHDNMTTLSLYGTGSCVLEKNYKISIFPLPDLTVRILTKSLVFQQFCFFYSN